MIVTSAGYITYDTFICIFHLGYNLKSGADFIVHHLVGLIGAVTVLIAGRFNVALSAGNIFSEWTTFPMNQRWRMLKHKQTEGLPFLIINAIFLMCYVMARIVFMATLIVRNYQIQSNFSISSDPAPIYMVACICTAMQVALYLIQLFWFRLIFGAFLRTLQGQKPMIASKDD